MMFFNIRPAILRQAPSFDPGVDVWKAISGYYALSAVDRIGGITMPYQLEVYEKNRLPTELNGFDLTYEQCCDRRAAEIVALARTRSVKIAMMWSGGIDSTVGLISLIKALSPVERRDRLTVYLDHNSMRENRSFYEKHIRKYCSFSTSLRLFNEDFTRDTLVVTGELNDQLFGTDLMNSLEVKFPGCFKYLLRPYTRQRVVDVLLLNRMSRPAADRWFDLLDTSAKRAPCEIKNTFQVFWWFNFVFKWQEVFFRSLLQVSNYLPLGRDYVENHVFHFFGTDYFQKWSMLNPHLKVKGTWDTYKFHAKELIHAFDGNDDYLKSKKKIGSLVNLYFYKARAPLGMDTDFNFASKINLQPLYRPDHFFR